MNFVAWMIVASEIGFWIVISLGLVTRYMLKKEGLGLFFLALTPLIDLVLLITTSIDLYNGATATLAHAIAAVYIGVSIAFGKSMIRWADERFTYYVTKTGSKPSKKFGIEHAKHYFKGWLRHLVAYAIGTGMLLILTIVIDDHSRTEALLNAARLWSLVLGIDLLISISHFIWPTKERGVR